MFICFSHPAVNISLTQSTYIAYELIDQVEVCARLLIKVLDKPVHVILSTVPGTATGEEEEGGWGGGKGGGEMRVGRMGQREGGGGGACTQVCNVSIYTPSVTYDTSYAGLSV